MINLVETDTYLLRGELDGPVMWLHLDYLKEKFNKSIYQEMMAEWGVVLDSLSASGIRVVASLIPKEWDKVQKWQVMFGLSPVYEVEDKILFRMEI